MKNNLILLIILSLAICWPALSKAQSAAPVKDMFSKMNRHIDKAERNNRQLLYMQCDLLTEGLNEKLGMIFMKKNHTYYIHIKLTNEVESAKFMLVDSGLNQIISSKLISGGSSKTFKVNNHHGMALIDLKVQHFREGYLQAAYAISVTGASRKKKPGRESDIESFDEDEPDEDDEPSEIPDPDADCSFDEIANLKFRTTTRWIKKKGKKKGKKTRKKATVTIDKSIKKVRIKMKNSQKESYTIKKKSCLGEDNYKLSAENEMGYRFIIIVDKMRNSFEISPVGSDQTTIFDMTKMNK